MKKIQIPLYNNPPEGLMQLEEMEKIVLARISLLEQFEAKEKDINTMILMKEDNINSIIELQKFPQNDLISHFMLCVANCKSDQSRTS